MVFKKKKLGFRPKTRTLDEINKDYNDHAIHAGHKQRVIKEIQNEVDHHVQRMLEINRESRLLPPPEAPAAPEPTPTQSGAV